VCHAVDRVVAGQSRAAFCCVRPPGHHAGTHGLLKDCISCGFCIFNNVMAGAMHAIKTYPKQITRVAVIDLDVHHGNGTENIIRRVSRDHPDGFFFFSTHVYQPHGSGMPENYEFYPGSGGNDDMPHNIVNAPLVPCWCTDKNRFTAAGAKKGGGFSKAALSPVMGSQPCSGRDSFKMQIRERLLPALRAYNPDLVFMSMGFDGAAGDVGNINMYLDNSPAGLDLIPEVSSSSLPPIACTTHTRSPAFDQCFGNPHQASCKPPQASPTCCGFCFLNPNF